MTLKTVGTRAVTATDTVTGSITGTQSGLVVTAAGASTLVLTGATGGTAGVVSSVTVTAKDAYNNTATGYTGTVHFTSTDGQASLPVNYTFVAATTVCAPSPTGSRSKVWARQCYGNGHRHGYDHGEPDRPDGHPRCCLGPRA